MHIKRWLRGQMTKRLYNERQVALKSGAFPLAPHFTEIDHLGLYLHIPFCRQICPYCPYNKELFQAAAAERYTNAVLVEIDHYATLVGQRPVTSFYIGGGTPTTMLQHGLSKLLDAIYSAFNMQCSIHLESHPNDLSAANLNTIAEREQRAPPTGATTNPAGCAAAAVGEQWTAFSSSSPCRKSF